MVIQKRYKNAFGAILVCFFLAFIFSCGSKTEYAGIYRTGEADEETRSELELKDDGEGYWRVGDNEELFSWYVKGDEIRLNTKKGGVIVAKIQGDILEITLSGGKKLSFEKIE
jgi:hypothetical protein